MTTYTEVIAADRDVAAFIASHLDSVNILKLPLKMWVARQDNAIVAVMMLKVDPYPSLDLILANPKSRPFMRVLRLWQMAEKWLREHGVPIICASIHNSLQHYQSLVRRFGFEQIGEEVDTAGNAVETVYARRLAIQ